MSEELHLESETDIRSRSWRGLSLLAVISLTVISSLVLGSSGLDSSSPRKPVKLIKTAGSPNAILSEPINYQSQPLSTRGPLCNSKILVLMDRSLSVVNNAGGTQSTADALKNGLIHFQNELGLATQPGSRAEVYTYAFADNAVFQNFGGGDFPSFWDWIPYANLQTNEGRWANGILVNQIHFRGSGGPLNNGPNLAWRGYTSASDDATNWDEAFTKAINHMNFWGGSTTDPDGDWDLVLMVTDGVPTINNASRTRTDGYVWSRPEDVSRARWGINSIRTGVNPNNIFAQVRAKTPVYGIFVNSPGVYSNTGHITPILDRTFGPGNWSNVNNAGLLGALTGISQKLTCAPAKKVVTPKIAIENIATSPSPAVIKEGGTGTITGTIRNTSQVQDNATQAIALYDLEFFVNGVKTNSALPLAPANQPSVVLHTIGSTTTFTLNFDVRLGSPAPLAQTLQVRAKAFYNGDHYKADPATGNIAISNLHNVQFDVVRIPLPT